MNKLGYVLTEEERTTVAYYHKAMFELRGEGGIRSILAVFAKMNDLRRINYCYHIEKLAYDDVPWAKRVMAKATALRITAS